MRKGKKNKKINEERKGMKRGTWGEKDGIVKSKM